MNHGNYCGSLYQRLENGGVEVSDQIFFLYNIFSPYIVNYGVQHDTKIHTIAIRKRRFVDGVS